VRLTLRLCAKSAVSKNGMSTSGRSRKGQLAHNLHSNNFGLFDPNAPTRKSEQPDLHGGCKNTYRIGD
jgi:hypothetical protein